MSDRLNRPLSGPTTLLFGPLALALNAAAVAQIRKTIIDNPNYDWILEAVANFPQQWDVITSALPDLQDSTGRGQAEDLADAFLVGRSLETLFPLPNKLLIPLVVMSHLTQYASFLERVKIELDDRVDIFAGCKAGKETVGFCTGLLSAIAVPEARRGRRAACNAYRHGSRFRGRNFGREGLQITWCCLELYKGPRENAGGLQRFPRGQQAILPRSGDECTDAADTDLCFRQL
jgi:hypothetical protein